MTTELSNNPLVNDFSGQDNCPPFDKIKTEHYLPAIEFGIAEANKNLDKIRNLAEPATFENSVLALETSSELVERVATIFGNLETANGDDEMHKLAGEIYPKLAAFGNDITLDAKLFARVKSVYENRDKLNLTAEQKKLTEKTFLNFSRNGALLDETQKAVLRNLDQELAALAPKFSENTLKATNAFELWIEDKNDLAGLPDSAIEAAADAAEKKGKKGHWFFNLQFPSYMPFLTYAKNRQLREKMWRAYGSRAFTGEFDNQKNILRIIELRQQRARLLGYKTHADFTLTERMAKDPATVFKFLSELREPSLRAAKKDLEEVKSFAKQLDNVTDLMPWDIAYYSEKLKEQKYAFNSEDLRPYFKLENVIEGVFEHARRLYGLTFKEAKNIPTYHPEVKVYEISEQATKKYVGLFYADFFPRETKKGGAWMTSFREQGLLGSEVRRPHISIVCNFTKPTSTKPSLLSYDEVTTLFHEFGHALHGMLSDCTYKSLSGTNVYWDFVELPSQIMENWAGEKEGLDLFARHFKTNEPLPNDLIEKIKKAERFQAGSISLRQLSFATLDMAWHTAEASLITDVAAFENEVMAETRLFPIIAGINSSCSFGHIFAGGYSAGYYSYKWAEVLDADAFEYFKEKGLFDSEVAKKFKENILSKGGTDHPMELYKKFRGREPDPKALLRRDGLI